MLFCIRHFSQTINFSRFSIPKSTYFCICSCFFMTFSTSIFALIFPSIFDGKWLPKLSISRQDGGSFWLPFCDLFRRLIFRCILVALWHILGSILAPFGSLLAPFWLPLAPFGSLLAPFGSLWLTFLLPLAHFLLLLAHFYSIFSLWASPGVVFGPFLIFSTKI